MDGNQRKRYEQLKNNNRLFVSKKMQEDNVLLQECIAALGAQAVTLPEDRKKAVLAAFNSVLKRAQDDGESGRGSHGNTAPKNDCDWAGQRVFIIWDGAGLPVIQSNLVDIMINIDDVKAVSFETWIASEDIRRIGRI